ncbi:MAG TPA: catalase, partial [Solirubrobacteraceae bacterium]|nr:catalase [Solirubrobacteraceae bacterium]
KWVNAEDETVLVKYHWLPKQGVKSWTEADAGAMQGQVLGVHTQDLYDAIERGDHPEWELFVQIMSDEEHPELDFDPLDDTKVWPEEQFPLRHVGRMVLNRVPENFFAESEQIAFGTGVLVDGLDFSEDKMLQGRTFSYSDTQRYRVGTNYLQLPVNSAKAAEVSTNQRDGEMTYHVDGGGENPHINYEPTTLGGLAEAPRPKHPARGPEWSGQIGRQRISRTNDYQQAGERYLLSEPWERDDLVTNLTSLLGKCDRHIQERMLWHLFMCEDELGHRVAEALGMTVDDVKALDPLATQTLSEAELERARNLGSNGPRDVEGKVMTHCVPNERIAIAEGETVSV